jgi:hypothetical protein
MSIIPASQNDLSKYNMIFVIGLFMTSIAYFPGLMSPDSEDQLQQARTFTFSDWHPVVMAFIWSATNKLIPGPAGLFIVLIALYWLGFFLIYRYFSIRRSKACFAISVIPFMPFVINFSGTLWKDTLCFDAYLLALGLILYDWPRAGASQPFAYLALIPITVGVLARYNSALAAIPLVSLILSLRWGLPRTIVALAKSLLASAGVVLGLSLSGGLILQLMLHPRPESPIGSLFLFDLVGISHWRGVNSLPGQWTGDQSELILSDCYNPRTWDAIWMNCEFVVTKLRTDGDWGRLFTPWSQSVLAHPMEYMHHRLAHVWSFFSPAYVPFNDEVTESSLAYGFRSSALFNAINLIIDTSSSTYPFLIMYSNGFWLVSSLVVFVACVFLPNSDPESYIARNLSMSAALYVTPLAVVGVGHDFRYVYWGIGGTCIALVFMADILSRRRSNDRVAVAARTQDDRNESLIST